MGEHAVTGPIVKVGWAAQLLRVAGGFPPVRKRFDVIITWADGRVETFENCWTDGRVECFENCSGRFGDGMATVSRFGPWWSRSPRQQWRFPLGSFSDLMVEWRKVPRR